MRILNRYLCIHVMTGTAVVVLVLIGIESFIEFVGQLSDIGVGHYGLSSVFLYVPLQLSTDLYQLFPVAGFLGSLMGLGRLASTSQLIVMRASGMSILQISVAVIKAALFMIIIVTIIGEWLGPQWQNKAALFKKAAMQEQAASNRLERVWLRRNRSYIMIGSVTKRGVIEDITRFDFDKNDQLVRLLHARKGKRVDGIWQLYDVQETVGYYSHLAARKVATEPLGIDFRPSLLNDEKKDLDQESIKTLLYNIFYRQRSGLITSQYQYAFWERVFQPVKTVVMICLGIPFVFGSLRSVSMGFRIVIGVIVGFAFYMLSQFFGPITLVYQFPPLLAAVLPTLLFLLVYVILWLKSV